MSIPSGATTKKGQKTTSTMNNLRPAPKKMARDRPGMTLLEVLLAVAVFGIAGAALVGALNQIAEAVLDGRQIRQIELSVESLIDEYSKVPQLQQLEQDIKAGSDGISYHVSVQPVRDIRNQENRELQGLFRIKVKGQWQTTGDPLVVEAETLRYAGSLLPVQ